MNKRQMKREVCSYAARVLESAALQVGVILEEYEAADQGRFVVAVSELIDELDRRGRTK